MRVQRAPNQGFMADHDMIGYWAGWGPISTSAATNWTTGLARDLPGSDGRNLLPFPAGKTISQTAHLFKPRDLTAYSFDGTTALVSAGQTLNDSEYCSNSSVGFSFATWYDLGSAATQTIIERSLFNGTLSQNRLQWQLSWLGLQNRFLFRGVTFSNTYTEVLSDVVPAKGFIGFDVQTLSAFAFGPGTLTFYSSSQFGGQIGSPATLSGALTTGVTNSSTRWIIGGSLFDVSGGSYLSPPTNLINNGKLCEIGLWRRPIGESRMRSAYAGCIQPWDDVALIESENYDVKTRVFVEDHTGVFQNLSDYDGQDWIQEVTNERNVADATDSASFVVRRRRGRLADMSPITTTIGEFSSFIALRRKVRIERAIVPSMWNMVGWEWKALFEGYIDNWEVSQDSVSVKCSDRSAVLNDAFITENRAYNFAVINKPAETAQQQIINDFEPAINSLGATKITIGYKGYRPLRPPVIYTEAGTVSTPNFVSSAFVLRYNDVSSGPVMDALQAITDQIGYATEFKYHEPWEQYRLTNYSPRRTKIIPHQSIREVDGTQAIIEFREPHGLTVGRLVTTSGTGVAALNFLGSVASVMDFYRVVSVPTSGGAVTPGSVAGSTGSVSFSNTYRLPSNAILGVDAAVQDIGSIRNHAIVRFGRNDSTATTFAPQVEVVGGILTVYTARNMARIDPTNNGITFTLSNGISTAAVLNGSYTGYVQPGGTVVSDVPAAAPDGIYNSSDLIFSSQNEHYQEVVSTASTSLAAYGYLPMAIYEGSNLAINTEAEAQRLANNLISDLAQPTVDMTLTMKVRPLELHDVLSIPIDRKGRWAYELDSAIVGISESYSSGQAVGQYKTRAKAPTRSSQWASRIAIRPGAAAAANNNTSNILEQANQWRLSDANNCSRQFRFARPFPERREMGLRHDQTEVWLSTASGFVPTRDNLAGSFRGDKFELTSDATGAALSPGTRYYVRFGDRDIFGNLSQITGVGAASAATTPSFVARFLDQSCGVRAVNVSGATYDIGDDSWAPMTGLDVVDGSDASAMSYDTFNNYSPFLQTFTAPCDGVFACSHRSAWFGDPLKAPGPWTVLGVFNHYRGTATIGSYGANGVVGYGATVADYLAVTAEVSCSSGDQLLFFRRTPTSNVLFLAGSTASINYGMTSYSLVHQQ